MPSIQLSQFFFLSKRYINGTYIHAKNIVHTQKVIKKLKRSIF